MATIDSIGLSTRIEGAKLTDAQVETLLTNLKTQRFQTRDEQKVAGYAEAAAKELESIRPAQSLQRGTVFSCAEGLGSRAARIRDQAVVSMQTSKFPNSRTCVGPMQDS